MKTTFHLFYSSVVALLLAVADLPAATHYVSPGSGSPTAPYTNWATAATNIQPAADSAAAGDEVVVTNGVYAGGLAVTKPLRLRSVNGPQATVIDGGRAFRCAFLTNGASMSGFTLTNGVADTGDGGGGVWCASTNAFLTNCVIGGNSAFGPLMVLGAQGGGASGGTLYNCTLTANSADEGGGAYSCTLFNCTLTGNPATEGGGASCSTLYNCTLSGNRGGPGYWELDETGYPYFVPGAGGGASRSTLYGCTLTSNAATDSGGGADQSTLKNCIVYFNTATIGANYDTNSTLNYCCTTPLPTNGFANITNAPLFVDYAGGNLRLQSNSPCINAGNNAFVSGTTDMDGNPRIVSGTVDIGAYEFQGPGSVISYAWLQQYGLPTDSSADFIDSDHDGMNNWQEWRCGTGPTNPLSALRLLEARAVGSDVTVTWQSVAGVNYFLERSAGLGSSALFTPVATGIPGQPGTTTFVDTNAASVSALFYRMGVAP